ncbi:MAG: L-seryl-tRNA(Sec) selenium transferase [Planctomycetota bacterium]|nr:L-seryl-tRNA(Sec) selenium transferase [Planctomycetota bacterium]
MATEATNPYRLLPAVEEVLQGDGMDVLAERVGREVLVGLIQETLVSWRGEIRAGDVDADRLRARLEAGELGRAVEALAALEVARGLRRVINATGVVLHTGLGRAPVHPEAAAAMAAAARSYCVLEVDRLTGERNQRDERLSTLLGRLTGAEAGIAVNNNAAAVLLALQTFAGGRAAIVSRGELVEIGGSFRIPDVMERAGVALVEVGTTNRTRADDYRKAVDDTTALLLKVHTSNFRLVGFTEEVSAQELGDLGRELGLPTVFDLGSGLLEIEGSRPLADSLGGEPLVKSAVASGVDVVTFSGDKLLGAPQAGLMVGKDAALRALRQNPIYRALRLDKVAIAGIERTLELLLEGRGDEIPARAMLLRGEDELRADAERIAAALDALPGLRAEVAPGTSQPGSGSAPGVELPTTVVRVARDGESVDELARRLRAADPPVFVRIHEDRLSIDPRTLLPGDEEGLLSAFRGA